MSIVCRVITVSVRSWSMLFVCHLQSLHMVSAQPCDFPLYLTFFWISWFYCERCLWVMLIHENEHMQIGFKFLFSFGTKNLLIETYKFKIWDVKSLLAFRHLSSSEDMSKTCLETLILTKLVSRLYKKTWSSGYFETTYYLSLWLI